MELWHLAHSLGTLITAVLLALGLVGWWLLVDRVVYRLAPHKADISFMLGIVPVFVGILLLMQRLGLL